MSKRLTTQEFIERANKVHNGEYDYSKVEYVGGKKKVCIICTDHGEFWQEATSHLNGCRCPKCAIDSARIGNGNFIKRANVVHNYKYDYSKVDYKRCDDKVCIICPEHGEFLQTPNNHLKGQGCPKCGLGKRKKGVLGIGVNNDDRIKHKEAYQHWQGMLSRCYGEKEQELRPTYKDCYVCEQWLHFKNFLSWFYTHHKKGWHLDKDILVKGNKEYAPDKCCFVPSEINGLFAKCTSIRGEHPIGVQYYNGVYIASMRKYIKKVYLGRYNDSFSAFQRYKLEKESWIKEVADKWKDQLEPKVYKALHSYKVEIDD